MASNGLFVPYCAKDFLDGTQQLGPWEELAYRRIVDLIYATDDNLRDDDSKLAWMTKVGRRWKEVKSALIEQGKIEVIDGRISNKRCRSALGHVAQKRALKADAGRISAEKRKSLKTKETTSTPVATPVGTPVATETPTDVQQNGNLTNEPMNYTLDTDVSKSADAPQDAPREDGLDASPALPVIDPKRMIFNDCLQWLAQATGKQSTALRGMVGKWIAQHGEAAVLDAFQQASRNPPVEPVAWMNKTLQRKAKPNDQHRSSKADGFRALLRRELEGSFGDTEDSLA